LRSLGGANAASTRAASTRHLWLAEVQAKVELRVPVEAPLPLQAEAKVKAKGKGLAPSHCHCPLALPIVQCRSLDSNRWAETMTKTNTETKAMTTSHLTE